MQLSRMQVLVLGMVLARRTGWQWDGVMGPDSDQASSTRRWQWRVVLRHKTQDTGSAE